MVTAGTVQQFAQAACGYFARAGASSGAYTLLKNALWTSFPGDVVVHDLIKDIKDAAESVAQTKIYHARHPDSASAEAAFFNAVDHLAEVTKKLCEHVEGLRV